MKILVISGPNLNLLGIRNTDIYGHQSYADLQNYIQKHAESLQLQTAFYQSNMEGDIVNAIQNARGVYDGIILNAAAYTHTSIAILDALEAVKIPCVEVHLSNIHAREEFRRQSYPARACIAQIAGCGFRSYRYALMELAEMLYA